MAVLRWVVGAILASFLLLWGLLPSEIRQMKLGEPSVAQAQEDTTEPKRVYTNDDWPFNRRRSAASASESETSKETGSPSSARERRGERLAPFVVTPMKVVEKMLEVAQVTSSDVVYDLGSGDGRIVIMAAEKYGAMTTIGPSIAGARRPPPRKAKRRRKPRALPPPARGGQNAWRPLSPLPCRWRKLLLPVMIDNSDGSIGGCLWRY